MEIKTNLCHVQYFVHVQVVGEVATHSQNYHLVNRVAKLECNFLLTDGHEVENTLD